MLPREKINHWIYKSKSGPFINVMILMLMISFVYSWNADKAYIYWPGTTHNSSKSHYRFSVLLCLLEDKNKKKSVWQPKLFTCTFIRHDRKTWIIFFHPFFLFENGNSHTFSPFLIFFLEKIKSSYNYSPKVNLL